MNRISLEKMFEVRMGEGRYLQPLPVYPRMLNIYVEECNKIARDENEKGEEEEKKVCCLYFMILHTEFM